MTNMTTIQLEKGMVEKLKMAREYPRQTYNELLERMIAIFLSAKKRDNYDKFLHHAQQSKMKELWDNKEDEAWNDV